MVSPLKFIHHAIDEFSMQVTYDPLENEGAIVYNLFLVPVDEREYVIKTLKRVSAAGITVSDMVRFVEPGDSIHGHTIPPGMLGICTVCSITLDGIFLRRGIPVNLIGGGIIEILENLPRRFTHMILYESTTIDPLQVLASQDITSVNHVMKDGNGRILGNIRECHMEAENLLNSVLDDLTTGHISGVLEMGMPNTPLLGVSVSPQYLGVVAIGGTNPFAVMKEEGHSITTRAMKGLMDIREMDPISFF
ncbi:DUF128 domain-containing protein [Methanocalculus alkaliphilus]|uniref:DUF128 domain-containing protein n=1 Tax=Methanocalculus alkaliphilus TaxID=768730 RepID=UPI002646F060|nr:DUF128 domain-containing protein [Methanocalculus alkaliphilus]